MLNRTGLALAAGVLLVACDGGGTGPEGPGSYEVTPLGTLAGAGGQPEPFLPDALNDAGQVAGATPSGAIGVWSGGAAVRVARTGAVLDLNEAGAVAGRDAPSQGAFLAAGAQLQLLAGTGARSWATGINEAGLVVGYGSHTAGTRAFVWNGGAVTFLDVPNLPNAFATAVNESGQVAGAGMREMCASVPEGAVCAEVLRSVVWQGAQRTVLPLMEWWEPEPGGAQLKLSVLDGHSAADINDAGEVAGTAFVHVCREDRTGCRSRSRAYLWRGGEMVDLGKLDDLPSTQALAVNRHGDVVGYAWSWDTSLRRPFLWRGGRLHDLSEAATRAGWRLEIALDINDRGQILGYGVETATGQRRGLLLTPVD